MGFKITFTTQEHNLEIIYSHKHQFSAQQRFKKSIIRIYYEGIFMLMYSPRSP